MLKLKDIKKDYKVAQGYVHALKGVTLAFRKNEFVSVLGPSGCGKTTLLNIIGGLDHYTSGDLVIQGKSTKDFKDRDWDVYRNHRIGFIFQSYNLIPHQTVLSNVELALTIAGVGKEERKARATHALERVGLGGELNKRPNQLSGGQMQRVAIARALVNNPDILLADEPTGALDSKTSVEVMELIKEIASERLVIMVTHNPELAEKYSSRIVRLMDGQVESDSDPYSEEEEAKENEEAAENSVEKEEPAENEESVASAEGAPQRKGKKPRAKMSFLTSLALSARNLLTKKGRTIVTSVAGSIGIISVCLVLALSSGFNNYIRRTEEDMLSYYPVEITESAFDLSSIMNNAGSRDNLPDMSQISDKVYVNSFLTQLAQGIAVTNDIAGKDQNGISYIDYVEAGRKEYPEWFSAIKYGYGVELSDNLFTKVETGGIEGAEGDAAQVQTQYLSLSSLKTFYENDVINLTPPEKNYGSLLPYVDMFFTNITGVMPGTSDLASEDYGKYVLSQYDVIYGHFPHGKEEDGATGAVLVVGDKNDATDLTLAQLGFLPEKDFMKLFDMGTDEYEGSREAIEIPFEEIENKQYTLYYNDAVYTRGTDTYTPFTYHGDRNEQGNLSATEEEGIPIRITAILRLKEDRTYGCLLSGINFTEDMIAQYIRHNKQSQIVKWMLAPHGGIFPLDNNSAELLITEEMKNSLDPMIRSMIPKSGIVYRAPAATPSMLENYTKIKFGEADLYITLTQDAVVRSLGGNDTPNAINLYPTDFDAKENVLSYLDKWNEAEGRTDTQKVTYTDRVGLLMGMMQTMLNVITYVLVAFTSISLVVSSVMIGIITYVSVVERVKEIGVLRSLGARKMDIRNLFNAETFIIGLAAGLIGVGVTYLLSGVISLIIYSLSGIAGIATLPPLTAFIMVCVSVALTLISGLIPAQAAAKKDPVIALRTE